jgi:hypothetical protein
MSTKNEHHHGDGSNDDDSSNQFDLTSGLSVPPVPALDPDAFSPVGHGNQPGSQSTGLTAGSSRNDASSPENAADSNPDFAPATNGEASGPVPSPPPRSAVRPSPFLTTRCQRAYPPRVLRCPMIPFW